MQKTRQLFALRMDDPGASSKRHEVYSNKVWRLGRFRISGNWLFLKYLPAYKAWGPYREMRASEWFSLLDLLERHKSKLTVAVTAAWVESQDKLFPFPERFPNEAKILKEGVQQGLIEVANHGLTHCIVEGNLFKPKLFDSNREFHREFGARVPVKIQDQHLQASQHILQSWLGSDVVTFVPPGNLFTEDTVRLAYKHGLKYISCDTPPRPKSSPLIIGNQDIFAFHDRDIVFKGVSWLSQRLDEFKGRQICFVRELAEGQATNGH
ncbi:MAG: polysaccharide deacetylase family protein [Anaerolineales bacterium]|nr:polysaccharide deacetylase family protein [Anaerolineales bacterium]